MGDDVAIWSLVFFAVALLLFFLEIFFPSGGILGVLSAGCVLTGIVLLFRVDTTYGVVASIVTIVSLPFLFALAMKIWPNTPIGRAMILHATASGDAGTGEATAARMRALSSLVGQVGEAKSELRPIGQCVIDGERRECLAVGGMIPAGEKVRVIAADGIQIKVRVLRDDELAALKPEAEAESAADA